MKTYEQRAKMSVFSILMSLCFAVFVSSCKKDDDPGTSATSNVMIVNSAEGSSGQDFYLDDVKVNSSAIAYTQTNGYFTVSSGSHKADFKSSGSSTVSATSNLNLQQGKYYTVYFTGNGTSSSSFFTEDDITAPAANMAKVRFVHLSPAAASAVDLGVNGGVRIISGLAYKTASAYQSVSSSTTFQLFATGSNTVALNLTGLTLQAGKIYTIYISGSAAATITYHVILNN